MRGNNIDKTMSYIDNLDKSPTQDRLPPLSEYAAMAELTPDSPAQLTTLESRFPPLSDLIGTAGDVRQWRAHTPKARKWIINDLIPAGEIGRLVSPGGTGKSWMLVILSLCVAHKLPFFGFEAAAGGKVLVLSAEDDNEELHRRFFAACEGMENQGHELTDDGMANIIPIVVRGLDFRLVECSRDGVNRNHASVQYMIDLIRETGVTLVVADPQMSFYGGEENSNRDAQIWIDTLRHIASETGAGFLIAHHANKSSINGNGDSDGKASARGASAFHDGCRYELGLTGMTPAQAKDYAIDDDDRGRYVRLTLPKANYCAPWAGCWLERGFLSVSDIRAVEKATKAKSSDLHEAIIDLVLAESRSGRYHSKTGLATTMDHALPASKNTIKTAINIMLSTLELIEIPLPVDADRNAHRNVSRVLSIPITR